MRWIASFLLIISFVLNHTVHAEGLLLRNLKSAQPGDYIIISTNKIETLMHIYEKKDQILTIEEIIIPESRRPSSLNWKEWVNVGAPGNTSWVMFDIDLSTGQMIRYYSFTKKNWFHIPDADNILSKLLNLNFTKIPDHARKRVGRRTISGPEGKFWHPQMIVEGQKIKGAIFDAWRARWPRDGSELSGKTIDVYLPQENQKFCSYFPCWLQINGVIGKAKMRIIDSGKFLHSPKPPLSSFQNENLG